jgi:hypothetical protein
VSCIARRDGEARILFSEYVGKRLGEAGWLPAIGDCDQRFVYELGYSARSFELRMLVM